MTRVTSEDEGKGDEELKANRAMEHKMLTMRATNEKRIRSPMRRRGVETRQPNRKVCDELEVSTTALASGRHDSVDRQTTARGKARAMHLSVCCMKLYLRWISNTSESL